MSKILVFIFALSIHLNGAFKTNEYLNAIKELTNNMIYEKDFNLHIAECLAIDPFYLSYKSNLTFDCDVQTGTPATSVHNLRPNDIKMVAALGDSLTAALGAKASTVLGLLSEYREVSWSMGAEQSLEKVTTLPNIIRKYNPGLVGGSLETTLMATAKTGAGFNAAVSGQEANHMFEQARTLITRIRENPKIDYANDWKLITLFIGGNDLCDFCNDLELHSPQSYVDDIAAALDLFHSELPRTFVNLVSVLNVPIVEELNIGLVCSTLHRRVCPCAAYPKDQSERKLLTDYLAGYGKLTEELAASGRYDTKDDFTVVWQPFFKDFQPPRLANGKIDTTYFAPDCFHFSSKSHAMSAVALWNNMFQKVGEKSSTFKIDQPITCPPKDHPYFYTNKN